MRSSRLTNTIVPLLITFCVSAGFFVWLQRSSLFPDPDSFYHVRMAQLMSEQGIIDQFPWLTYTNLAAHFTDQHFFYHIFLIPFVTWGNALWNAKMATALLNAGLMTLIAAFLMRFRVRFWFAWVLMLLITNPFLFRIDLVKAPGLSVGLLVIGLWLLFTRRIRSLAVLSFVYVWTYGGFSLLAIFAGVYGLLATWISWNQQTLVQRFFRSVIPTRWHWNVIRRSPYLRMFFAVLAGIALGLAINPFFPHNLFFYWEQLVQIGIVNFQSVVNVGGEWRPYPFFDLLANTVFVTIGLLIGTVVLFIHRRKQTAESWTLWVLSVFFLLITLKSRRYVELYVPFTALFAAFSIRDAFPRATMHSVLIALRSLMERRMVLTTLIGAYILVTTTTIAARDTRQLYKDLRSGFQATYLQGAATWLAEHTPQDSIVVHSDWDEFPSLFYYNTHNRYIVGLDPTFMYQFDRVRYKRWADLTSGKRSDDATDIITNDLHAQYVVATKDHQAFLNTMERQTAFAKVYEDSDAAVFAFRAAEQAAHAPTAP